ncbi:MAG: hypothetical protein K5696_03085 [Lachnospiraceae bacterium]|nr:hypothetical protein [Lachnospiraceae bacterium]
MLFYDDGKKTVCIERFLYAAVLLVSMGTAFGNYENEEEFRRIIAEADSNMYRVKSMREKGGQFSSGNDGRRC